MLYFWQNYTITLFNKLLVKQLLDLVVTKFGSLLQKTKKAEGLQFCYAAEGAKVILSFELYFYKKKKKKKSDFMILIG